MSSNDTPYNPAEETINSILTGLLPVLIFGLFNGFEDDKKKKISMINIFDDFVIFASIIIYPLITAIEWYQYYTRFNKIMVITCYTISAIFGIISYGFFLIIRCKIGGKGKKIEEGERKDDIENGNNKNKVNEGENNDKNILNIFKSLYGESFACVLIMILLTIISFAGYYYVIIGDLDIDAKDINHISNYCTENFGVNKCNNLKIINRNVYVCSLVFSFLQLFYIIFKVKFLCFLCEKPENDILRRINRFTSILKHINIIIITVFPAIVSGYLISTNSITTKIAFGICTLSFTRLVNHFNEKPEKVNTLISFYLNGNDYKDKEQIEKLTEDMDELTKKLIDKVKYLNKQQDKKLTINHFNENPEKVNTLISFYLNDNDYKDKEQIEKLTEDMDELTKKLNYKIDEIKYLNEQNKERKYIELN